MSKKRPTKKSFYEYMSLKFKRKYKDEEAYITLLDIVSRASKDDAVMMEMAELIKDGKLTPRVTESYPLDDFVDAFAAITERRARGKVILRM